MLYVCFFPLSAHVLYSVYTLTWLLHQIAAASPQMLYNKLLILYVHCFLCCVLDYSVNLFDFVREFLSASGI